MGTKSFQRERRFLCGTSKNAANYQEVEIYPMNGTEQSRTLDQELARAADLRRSSKAQQNQNAKNARRLFRQLVNTNFTEEDTHNADLCARVSPGNRRTGVGGFSELLPPHKREMQGAGVAEAGMPGRDGVGRGKPRHRAKSRRPTLPHNFAVRVEPRRNRKLLAPQGRAPGPREHGPPANGQEQPGSLGKLYAEIPEAKAQIFPKPRNQKPDNTAPGGREMDAPPSAKNLHRRAAVRPRILGEKIPRLGLERSQRKL